MCPFERLMKDSRVLVNPLKNYFERSNTYEFKFFEIKKFSLMHRLPLDHYYFFLGLITTSH